MRKFFPIFLVLALIFFLCGCGKSSGPAMYIQPAQLTEEEQNIAKLADLNMNSTLFDFHVDETVRTMDIRAYELIDGEWDIFYGGGGQTLTGTEGRIYLDFDRIAEGIRVAIQSENLNGSDSWKAIVEDEPAGTSRATSLLSQQEEIVYGQEIPLAVQIVTTKNEIRSYDPSYYFHPEDYAKYGYEHVYAITVLFSQEPLN